MNQRYGIDSDMSAEDMIYLLGPKVSLVVQLRQLLLQVHVPALQLLLLPRDVQRQQHQLFILLCFLNSERGRKGGGRFLAYSIIYR